MLLLDESLGALDPGTKDSIHERVLRLWHETRMTIFIMVTHDLQAPERFGATVTYDLTLDRRKPPGEILRAPAA